MNPNDDPALATPPHSAETETTLLGGLLLDNGAWDQVADVVIDADFYRHQHRLIYAAVAKLINENKPADVITVFEELRRQGKADEVGGLPYLNSLAQYVPSARNIRQYGEIIRKKSILRQIALAADRARTLAYSDTEPSIAIETALSLFSGVDVRHGAREPRGVESLAADFMGRIDALSHGRIPPGISTGLPTLDRHLGGGLKPGRQIVIAARPGIGKSSLAMQLLLSLTASGTAALFISQEMETSELMDRIVANLGYADLEGISTGDLTPDGWSRVVEGVERLRDRPLYLHAESALGLAAIRSLARKMVRQHNTKVIVLDYLQLCSASTGTRASSRHHQLEELSRGLKALAMELGITTIVLSQLNREVEKRGGGRPILADLKESGSIEEDADAVILLSRESCRDEGVAVIHAEIPKCRGGRSGSFMKLAFDGRYQRWTETSGDAALQKRRSTAFE